jgi:cbb3-type cytochrome c oxidase subunit III
MKRRKTIKTALRGMGSDRANTRGYNLFVQHCSKCHELNDVGGTMGPELNNPCSVTEYWNLHFLGRFIERSTSIRSGSKMPPFPELSEADISAVVKYLQFMARRKTDCDTLSVAWDCDGPPRKSLAVAPCHSFEIFAFPPAAVSTGQSL